MIQIRKLIEINSRQSLRRHNPKKPKNKKTRYLLINIFFILSVLIAGFFIYVSGIEKRLQKNIKTEKLKPIENKPFNILILGKDAKDFKTSARSDTMIVAHIDPEKRKTFFISIPRDTKVRINGKTQKINAAYPIGGPQLAREEVEELLDIEIARFYVLNWEGFEKIVDLLGGVWIDVEKPMYYKSKNADIDLKPGKQLLDGQKALGYVRFRNDRHGDLGRIPRQQKFIIALIEQSKEIKNIVKMPVLIDGIVDNVMTNSSATEILWLTKTFWNMGESDMQTITIPGEAKMVNSVSYFIADEKGASPISASLGWRTKEGFESGKVAIAASVYNASNIDGLARETSKFLKSAGFSIDEVGTSSRPYKNTTIIYTSNNKEKAKLAAYYLSQRISDVQMIESGSNQSKPDLSVYIGKKGVRPLASLDKEKTSPKTN